MDGRRFHHRPPPLGKERRAVTPLTYIMILLGAVELARILDRMLDVLEGRYA